MDPSVLTISLNRWMSLPTVGIEEWCRLMEPEEIRKSLIMRNSAAKDRHSHKRDIGGDGEEALDRTAGGRVPVGTVAAYYEDYVRFQGLEKYFKWSVPILFENLPPRHTFSRLIPFGNHRIGRSSPNALFSPFFSYVCGDPS